MIDIDIEFVKETALEAGSRALKLIESMTPEFKADSSYVTDVDRETEMFVRERLASRYPDFGFLGEEYGRHGDENAPLWAVDPIDGTTNMVFGLPVWCVSIGLIYEGEAIAGAIHMPRTNDLYWAVKGQGAFCNGKKLNAIDREVLHLEDTLGFTSGAIKTLNPSHLVGRLRCIGSIAMDIAFTARGSLCCLVGLNEGAYDMAAALCMAKEAGCVSVHLNGEPMNLDAILKAGKTHAPFVIAPPKMAALIQKLLAEHQLAA